MPRHAAVVPKRRRPFDAEAYLESTGPARKVVKYRRGEVAFAQGDPADDIRYIQKGAIKISVLSRIGKEAVVAMLSPGDFFGEGALAGQSVRIETATAMTPSSVLIIEKEAMVRLLHEEPLFADRFLSHMLSRNIRIEADLVDQLFNSSEKRLARTLLLLARYGQANPQRTLPKISQETLAEMIGATRTRVNFFMNKFRKLGFIEYNGGLKVNTLPPQHRPARLIRSGSGVEKGATCRTIIFRRKSTGSRQRACAKRLRIDVTMPSRIAGSPKNTACQPSLPGPRPSSSGDSPKKRGRCATSIVGRSRHFVKNGSACGKPAKRRGPLAEEARAAAEAARHATMEAVQATADTLQATLENMKPWRTCGGPSATYGR